MTGKTPWDERYATGEYLYGTRPNDFLASMVERLPVGRTLCVAEGEGRNAVWLAQQGHQVTAVDASRVGLEKAQRLARQQGVAIETVVADLGDFSLEDGSYDLIVSIYAHAVKDARIRLHHQIVKALSHGGMFLLEAYTPRQLAFQTGGPPDVDKLMTLDGLREELRGLEFLHGVELEREVIEGSLHTGLGAVVQVLAKKPE